MENCIFCKIANGEIPTNFVYEDERLVAFRDIAPAAPVHILIVPKEHVESVNDLEENGESLAGEMVLAARAIAKDLGIMDKGYRLVINTGEDGGQAVGHLHLHLLAGRSMQWPPG